MFLPELGQQIQGELHLSSNNQIIRISVDSNNRDSTVDSRLSVDSNNRESTVESFSWILVSQLKKIWKYQEKMFSLEFKRKSQYCQIFQNHISIFVAMVFERGNHFKGHAWHAIKLKCLYKNSTVESFIENYLLWNVLLRNGICCFDDYMIFF